MKVKLSKKSIQIIAGVFAVLSLTTTFAMAHKRQRSKLSGAQEAYVADLAGCLASNHTLVNSKEVGVFLSGRGKDDVQILSFMANKDISSLDLGINHQPSGLSLGAGVNLSGYKLKTLALRRKLIDNRYAFQVDEGRFWVPKSISDCEKLRTEWTLFDSALNYEFLP